MTLIDQVYDVIVIGAGVAGAHAAMSAGRRGARTLLLTSSWDGVCYLAWGPRFNSAEARFELRGIYGQKLMKSIIAPPGSAPGIGNGAIYIDGHIYQGLWKYALESHERVAVFQDTCEEIGHESRGWRVATKWGQKFRAKSLVLAVGTFLDAEVASGQKKMRGGRPGDTGADDLGRSLIDLGLELEPDRKMAGPIIAAEATVVDRLRENMFQLEPVDQGLKQFYVDWHRDGHGQGRARLTESELDGAHIIKPAFAVNFRCIKRANLDDQDGCVALKGFFAAGKVVGARSYADSARQGIAAGRGAARVSRET